MKKGNIQKFTIIIVIITLMISLSGCSLSSKKEKAIDIKVSFDGTEITLGKATPKELLDAKFEVTSDNLLKDSMEGKEMSARTYDLGYLGKDGKLYSQFQLLNKSKEKAIPYTDCIINNVTVYYSKGTNTEIPNFTHPLINGFDFNGKTVKEVDAEFAKDSSDTNEINNPDGSLAIKTYYLGKNYISVTFDMESKKVSQIEIEIFHSNY